MGNKICVDKKPSPIENIISFNPEILQQSEISDLSEQINKNSTSYQHLIMWCLSEINQNNQNNPDSNSDLSQKIIEEKPKILLTPVELANIHKNHFLLDSQNVYILLLIFKKGGETDIENSPFPTGFWGIIESSSNMTPRGLLFAFPAKQTSQNLESFLLSKRELNDSEFKFMLFIWNGKKSTAFLRSVSLMKAFDLDKALMSTELVHFIYEGFYFNEKNTQIIPEYTGCVQLGDIINNTIENSEDNSTPSSDKINRLQETVYLFKLLYPNTKYKKKHKNKKNKKTNILNLNSASNNENNDKKEQNILYKGFNSYFLENGNKKSFYDNFTDIDIGSSNNNLNFNLNNNINNFNNIDLNELSNNFSNNNNMEKSNLSNSTMKNNKNIVMPPKLNLNLNISGNQLIGINSLEDTSNSKSSLRMPSSKEENKRDDLINGLNSNNNINKQNNEQQKQANDININNKKEKNDNKLNEDEYIEEEDDEDDDLDLNTNNDLLINRKYLIASSTTNNDNSLKKIKVPKLMVSLQKNPISEEKLTERAKIKSE